ncbi:MAG TPA: hypothetical protein VGA69_01650, partial [Nitriliruptorales bacterium]
MTGQGRVLVHPGGVREIARVLRADGRAIHGCSGRLAFTSGVDARTLARLAQVAAWCDGAARELEQVAER